MRLTPFPRTYYYSECTNRAEQAILNQPPNLENRIILITTVFECKNTDKYSWWSHCLNKNTEDISIETIVLFVEGFDEPGLPGVFNVHDRSKIKIVNIDARPSFYTLIDYANTHYLNRTVAIANSDIYFENMHVVTNIQMDKVLFALSRYSFAEDKKTLCLPLVTNSEYPATPTKLTDIINITKFISRYPAPYINTNKELKNRSNPHTADCWVFKPFLQIDDTYKNIFIGSFRCDNQLCKRFIDKIFKEGYLYINPCLTVKPIHYDFSQKTYLRDTHTSPIFEGVHVLSLYTDWCYISNLFVQHN